MFRLILPVVLGCGMLLTSAGCCCGPMTPHHMRMSGIRLSSWLNSPVCSHHRRRQSDSSSSCRCHNQHEGYCYSNINMCSPCVPMCGPVMHCEPACCNEVSSPCGNPDDACGECVKRAAPQRTNPVAPPAAPPETPNPVPDQISEEDHQVRANPTEGVRHSHWAQSTDTVPHDTTHPQVMLPGHRVSHRELRAVSAEANVGKQGLLVIPAE